MGTMIPGAALVAYERLQFADDVVEILEVVAIVLIVSALINAFVRAVLTHLRRDADAAVAAFKHSFSRGLLVGLDVLIAADIIKSITIDQTLETAAALGVIVLVRIFLSWSLIVETEERWPWQPSATRHPSTSQPPTSQAPGESP